MSAQFRTQQDIRVGAGGDALRADRSAKRYILTVSVLWILWFSIPSLRESYPIGHWSALLDRNKDVVTVLMIVALAQLSDQLLIAMVSARGSARHLDMQWLATPQNAALVPADLPPLEKVLGETSAMVFVLIDSVVRLGRFLLLIGFMCVAWWWLLAQLRRGIRIEDAASVASTGLAIACWVLHIASLLRFTQFLHLATFSFVRRFREGGEEENMF